MPVIDVFRIEGIRTKNCFSAPLSAHMKIRSRETESGGMAIGLWTYVCYMNHRCVPNSMRSFLGDVLISRATRDIRKGEELFPSIRASQGSDGRAAEHLSRRLGLRMPLSIGRW